MTSSHEEQKEVNVCTSIILETCSFNLKPYFTTSEYLLELTKLAFYVEYTVDHVL